MKLSGQGYVELALFGGAAFLLYKIIQSINATSQQVTDWVTGGAVYDFNGNRIPLSNDAQAVLNAGNILPTDVLTTSGTASDTGGSPASQTVVKAFNAQTGQFLYIDPSTGNLVS